MDRNLKTHSAKECWAVGQARKSLWIETYLPCRNVHMVYGQARKSLWIETDTAAIGYQTTIGQARKSLWIETFL